MLRPRALNAICLSSLAVLACGPRIELRAPPACTALAKETGSAAPKDEVTAGPIPKAQDGLLDSLVGEWQVTGVVRAKKKTEKVVRAAWVLNHQFVELHYRDRATPSTYEAIVYIGPDGPA